MCHAALCESDARADAEPDGEWRAPPRTPACESPCSPACEPRIPHAPHAPPRACASQSAADTLSGRAGSKRIGAAFEARALEYLRRQRMRLVARNVSCRGGEIDLVMRDADGALVFVEVRARAHARFGGAAASVGWHKRRRIVRAAQYFLARNGGGASACRFDVVAFDGARLVWLRDAFRADDA